MSPADVSSRSEFFDALKAGDYSTVEVLLARDPALVHAQSEDGTKPAMIARYYGEDRIAELLVERGAEIDIFAATVLGRMRDLQSLLDATPDLIHSYSPDGWTALHLAGHFGCAKSAETLLDRGADIGALSHNRNGNTPLHAALAGRRRDVALLLIERGTKVSAVDAQGWTPLHLAAHWGNADLVRILLDRGASPNAATNQGITPLVLASQQGHSEVVELLRERGADSQANAFLKCVQEQAHGDAGQGPAGDDGQEL